MSAQKCHSCDRLLNNKKRRPDRPRSCSDPGLRAYILEKTGRQIEEDGIICNKCFMQYYIHNRGASANAQEVCIASLPRTGLQEQRSSDALVVEEKLTIRMRSMPSQHRKCCLCEAQSQLHVVPQEARLQALLHAQVHIPSENRCCIKHLLSNRTLKHCDILYLRSLREDLQNRCVQVQADFLLSLLDASEKFQQSAKGTLNFDDDSALSQATYSALTGLTKSQFDELANILPQTMPTGSKDVSRKAGLAIFLAKLRTGEPNAVLASIFGVKSKAAIARIISKMRIALLTHFVPFHVGVCHLDRDTFVKEHVPNFCHVLTEADQTAAVLVVDGTYSYIQKSQNNEFQIKSYSLHKNRSLLKPMMIVGPDGYILHCIQHYASDHKNNDAAILQHAMSSNPAFKDWLNRGDVFVVDRGFLDARTFLENEGYALKMPAFLPKGEKQLSTGDANSSRIVTKLRFVVEVTNRRWREFRFFSNVIHNVNYLYLNDYTQITCALINAFRKRIVTQDEPHAVLAQKMIDRFHGYPSNLLKDEVESEGYARRHSLFEIVDAEQVTDFPRIQLQDIECHITLGPYQVQQARNYIAGHVAVENRYMIGVHKQFKNLLRAKINSRHKSAKAWYCWVRYIPHGTDPNSVLHWYCQCKCGARTVGCCSHVSSLICYLSFYRFNLHLLPAPHVHQQFLDAAEMHRQ
jgi:hypothetical protein